MLEECPQLIQLFLGRARMDTVHTVMLVALHEISRADVRSQHAFFNQTMRIVSSARQNLFNFASSVTDDIGFGRFEIHGAAFTT